MATRARLMTLVAVIAVLALAFPVTAQERVAQLSEASGAVTIERATGGTVDQARQQGPRVRNGSVYSGDVVTTGEDGTTTMVFTDGSEIKLKPGTSLKVRQVDFSKLMAEGHVEKPTGRVIQVMAGSVWMHIVPNPQLATEFETPSGVAAVKGTTLTISVEEGIEEGIKEGI